MLLNQVVSPARSFLCIYNNYSMLGQIKINLCVIKLMLLDDESISSWKPNVLTLKSVQLERL